MDLVEKEDRLIAVKIREIPPGNGKWYVKVDYRQRRVAKCFSSLERAQEVADEIATVNAGDQDARAPGREKRYSCDSVRLMVMTMRAMFAEAVREKLNIG